MEKMKFRHELKYLINTKEYLKLRQKLIHTIPMDKNSIGIKGYKIRSLYFDDMYNSALEEKEAGIYLRKKYRIRIYNDEDTVINFEKKNKCGQFINKESVKITRDEFDKIINNDIEFMIKSDKKLLREIYIQMRCNILRPVVIVDYDREAHTYEYGNVRITFDKDLRASFNSYDIFDKNLASKKIFVEDFQILEIKFDEYLPEFIRNLIQMESGYNEAISKYVYCRQYMQYVKI